MTTKLQSYEAQVAFGDETKDREIGNTIQFLAADDEAACLGAYRWFQNRNAAIPEHYTTLYCIKVYRLDLTEFREDGYLPQNIGMTIFEWKYDWHPDVPFETYLKVKMRQRQHRH